MRIFIGPDGREHVTTVRLCIGCGQSDDHPRHGVMGQEGWHMDCHVLAADCPVCRKKLDGVFGTTGDALRTHLLSQELDAAHDHTQDPAGSLYASAVAPTALEG